MCSNYIPGAKNGPAQGVTCFTLACIGKCEKIFLSEPTGPKALIFGIKHHLVDLYQVCSNCTPGARNDPAPGTNVTHRLK